MLEQILDSFLSKLGELISARAHNNVNSIKDFKLTLKTLEKNLKSLSAKASDVEEEIKNAELSGQKKRKREVEEWLTQVKSIETEVLELGAEVESAGFFGRFMCGGKAARLNEEVDKLVEQSRHFGDLLIDICGARGETLLTNRMVGGAFKENFERIWRLLVTAGVSRIGVHGMGGVGKTTLVKHINNRLLEQSQGRVFWVTVSQEFTIKNLQDKIACFLGVKFLYEDNEDIRAMKLHNALSKIKKSVLIFDDVWEYIDLVKVGCPISVECCRLIITTRSLEVCRQIGCQEVIAVQKLHETEAWKLFNETFTLGEEIKLNSQVEEIAKCLVSLCDGLPLGIITLAGSMRGETGIHAWRNALVELKESVVGQEGIGEVEVFKVLKYSFDRLNTNHQSGSNEFNLYQLCFLYCSLYPEDKEIRRDELVRKLISEGLLDKSSRREQMHQGHFILDKLVNVCLLEITVGFFGCVKMHDLVRAMALKIVEAKYMVRAGDLSLKEIPNEEEWTKDVEKVSLMNNGITTIGDGMSPNCPNISTLLLQGNPLGYIPVSFFSNMEALTTLDLCRTNIRILPNSLSGLKSLKALLLEECGMLEYVPDLGELKALRELNLSGTAINEVPQGVEELLNLKFLSIDAPKLKMLPRGLLLKLRRLQFVIFPQHLDAAIEEMENLKRLEEFWGRVANVSDFNCVITSWRSRKHDTFYRIGVRSQCKEEYFELYNKGVTLSLYNLQEEKLLGQDIECLTIEECQGLSKCLSDDFSRLNNPRSLQRLMIEKCGGIEYILTSEQLMSAQELPSAISTLASIELKDLKDFKGVIHIPPAGLMRAVFSSLRKLHISECNKMKKLGLPISELLNLEIIEVECCGEIEVVVEDEGRVSVSLPRLKVIKLWGLPRLKSICKATMICNSIEEFNVTFCPSLVRKQPLHLEGPPSSMMREIMVDREWWESLEWEDTNLPHLLQPFLHFF